MEDFSGIAVNSVVMPGIIMARGSILGVNSFLKENTEPWGIYVGNPATLMGFRDKDKILESAHKLGYE
jgi:acetyltransferase-like isoleucine patch superfamily enzyme